MHYINFCSTILVTYELEVHNICPRAGSIGGGALVTITGAGFNNNVHVMIGDNLCNTINITSTQIICEAPIGGKVHLIENIREG